MKTLIICETIFCDNETDKTILNTYFDRFIYTIKSMNIAINNSSSSFDTKWFIYISSDKIEFIKKLNNIISNNINISIIVYEHTYELYNISKNSHIDKIKSPNKSTPKLRDNFFKKAFRTINYSNYSYFIRCCLDDDDLVNLFYFENIYRYLNFVNIKFTTDVVGLALSNTNIVYIGEKIEVNNVRLSKALTGNKYYYFKSIEKLHKFSPYGFPENIDKEINEQSQKNESISYSFVNNVYTNLNYIRWGNNLSNQSKSELIIKHNYSYQLEDLHDLIKNEEIYLSETKLKIFGKIDNDLINFGINGDCYCQNNDYIAYYIYIDKIPVYKTSYKLRYFSDTIKLIHEYTSKEIIIKAFVKRGGKVIETIHKRIYK